MSARPAIWLETDPLAELARRIVEDHATELPDLSGVSVVLPAPSYAGPFRRQLLEAARACGCEALLPPFVGTLDQWFGRHGTPAPNPVHRVLVLSDLLRTLIAGRMPFLAPPEHLALATDLLAIFDEWERRGPASWPALMQSVQTAYGAADALAPMTAEARLVYEGWEQWRRHTAATPEDSRWRQRRVLRAHAFDIPTHLYVCGIQDWDPEDRAWLEAEVGRGRISLALHAHAAYVHQVPASALGSCPSAGACAQLLTLAFAEAPLDERVREARALGADSPLLGRIQWFEAGHFEEEAQTVAAYACALLPETTGPLGIVIPDRKLARRVRALLAEAGIALSDSAGWRLSTTSAAQALKIWWDAAVAGFDARSLAALAQSPFFDRSAAPGGHRSPDPEGIVRAGGALAALMDGQRHRLSRFLETLLLSLEACGLAAGLERDEAGRGLLSELEALAAVARGRALDLNAQECFAWLTDWLESCRFARPDEGARVHLLGVNESRLYHFNTVILAGASEARLPGAPPRFLFFNESVRHELGLAPSQAPAILMRDLLRLLGTTPRLVLGWRREDSGEALSPSPWLERLRLFHHLVYGQDLVRCPAGSAARSEARPAAARPRARPSAPAALTPRQLSARAYQRLIDCPYQYYAAEVLGLRARPELDEDRSRADFGDQVHQILEAFHQGRPGLPGPFAGPLVPARRPEAEQLLEQISHAVFQPASDFAAQLAFDQWMRCLPEYLTWEMEHSRYYRPRFVERRWQKPLAPGLELTGRLDRIDETLQTPGTHALLDYKTGRLPPRKELLNGEQGQLPFYAVLFGEPLAQACLIGLKDPLTSLCVAQEELETAAHQTRARLLQFSEDLEHGAGFPAHGSAGSCALCPFPGVCRRPFSDDP